MTYASTFSYPSKDLHSDCYEDSDRLSSAQLRCANSVQAFVYLLANKLDRASHLGELLMESSRRDLCLCDQLGDGLFPFCAMILPAGGPSLLSSSDPLSSISCNMGCHDRSIVQMCVCKDSSSLWLISFKAKLFSSCDQPCCCWASGTAGILCTSSRKVWQYQQASCASLLELCKKLVVCLCSLLNLLHCMLALLSNKLLLCAELTALGCQLCLGKLQCRKLLLHLPAARNNTHVMARHQKPLQLCQMNICPSLSCSVVYSCQPHSPSVGVAVPKTGSLQTCL